MGRLAHASLPSTSTHIIYIFLTGDNLLVTNVNLGNRDFNFSIRTSLHNLGH